MWYGWFSFLWWSSYICIGIVSPLSLVKTFCRVPSPNVRWPLNDQILNKFHHLVHWHMNEICWTCSKFRIYALYIHLKKKKGTILPKFHDFPKTLINLTKFHQEIELESESTISWLSRPCETLLFQSSMDQWILTMLHTCHHTTMQESTDTCWAALQET